MKQPVNFDKVREYEILIKNMDSQQLLGTYKIGDLVRTCTHSQFRVELPSGEVLAKGRALSGQSMRNHIAKAVRRWVVKNP